MSPLPFPLRRLLALAAVCAVAMPVFAAEPLPSASPGIIISLPTLPAVLPADVLRLLDDLRAIVPGTPVTDEEKQALAADLTALAGGLVLPSAASLEQLADDLAAAAASGKLTRPVETLLARDLAAVLGRSTLDPTALRALVDEVRTILAAYGIDDADLQQLAADLETILDDFQTDSASLHQVITLRAEGIPPFLLMNYGGHAKLVTVRAEGLPARTVLSIETFGLPPANPFTVTVTRRSDGAQIILGTLKVRTGGHELTHPQSAAATESATGPVASPQAELDTHGDTVFGAPGGKALPDGFDPTDLDTLTLTDSNGTERLTGSFVEAADLQVRTRLVNLRVDAGEADPGAAGAVSFRAKTTGTKSRDAFLLYVGGLPASAAVTLVADGAAVGTFTTTAGGQLVVVAGAVPVPTSVLGRMLPVNALPAAVDLDTLGTVTLTDATGNVLATAGM